MAGSVYDLEGTLLEACSCGVLCPCWVGADPDGGECDSFNNNKFNRGVINGIEVSGLAFINVCHIPGNDLAPGSWQVVSSQPTALTPGSRFKRLTACRSCARSAHMANLRS
jgi:hypothetical protein